MANQGTETPMDFCIEDSVCLGCLASFLLFVKYCRYLKLAYSLPKNSTLENKEHSACLQEFYVAVLK